MPFFHEKNRLINNDVLKAVCIDYVKQNGGAAFFDLPDWENQLHHLVTEYQRAKPGCDAFETLDEQKGRIALNLQQARDMIEGKLSDKNVRHLAYPWGTGSDIAVQCSQKTGYVSNYWATIPYKSLNTPGSDPYYMVRCKHDFIWRLPGEGRKSLRHIFSLKLNRRTSGQLDY